MDFNFLTMLVWGWEFYVPMKFRIIRILRVKNECFLQLKNGDNGN
jgi:hypothetical protein